jgi:hypothetical protein
MRKNYSQKGLAYIWSYAVAPSSTINMTFINIFEGVSFFGSLFLKLSTIFYVILICLTFGIKARISLDIIYRIKFRGIFDWSIFLRQKQQIIGIDISSDNTRYNLLLLVWRMYQDKIFLFHGLVGQKICLVLNRHLLP